MSNSASTNGSSLGSVNAAINDCITGNTTDINATVDALCQPIEGQYEKNEDVTSSLRSLWNTFIVKAKQTAYDDPARGRLADLLVAIADRPTLQRNGEACIIQDMTVWKDLPTFGHQLRDAWNFDPASNTDPKSQTQWLNLNAWTSQLCLASQTNSIPALDNSLFGLWTIREGLENTQNPNDGAVEAAAIWLSYGSSLFSSLSQQSRSFQGKLAQPGPLFQDRGWTGFSTERWGVWAQRLSDVQGSVTSERTAGLVQRASDAMAACGSE